LPVEPDVSTTNAMLMSGDRPLVVIETSTGSVSSVQVGVVNWIVASKPSNVPLLDDVVVSGPEAILDSGADPDN